MVTSSYLSFGNPDSITYCTTAWKENCMVKIRLLEARKHASEGSTLALKLRADFTRSAKQEYQWLHKKDSCPLKILKKRKRLPVAPGEEGGKRPGLGGDSLTYN